MMALQIFFCAILCLPSALTIAVDVQELDNQILVTGEVTLPDCKLKEHTKWDKMMTMLENSHMRQNMLLQYFEEFKMELQIVKRELWQLGANTSGSCSDCLKSITTDFSSLLDSKCQPQNTLNKNVEQSIADNQDIADRLQRIENLLKKREEADQNNVEPAEEPQSDSVFAQTLDPVLQDLLQTQNLVNQSRLPAECVTAILFPVRSPKIFASVFPKEMSFQAFTLCVWIKVTEALEKTIVVSYGTRRDPHEIQLYLKHEYPVLVVGKEELSANSEIQLGEWYHLCGTWNSVDGEATLWVDGENKIATFGLAQGHTISDKGLYQLGQEKYGCCGGRGFDESLAFSGEITGFNLWDSVLDDEDIVKSAGEFGCEIQGNVIGWGTTPIQPHGEAEYFHQH